MHNHLVVARSIVLQQGHGRKPPRAILRHDRRTITDGDSGVGVDARRSQGSETRGHCQTRPRYAWRRPPWANVALRRLPWKTARSCVGAETEPGLRPGTAGWGLHQPCAALCTNAFRTPRTWSPTSPYRGPLTSSWQRSLGPRLSGYTRRKAYSMPRCRSLAMTRSESRTPSPTMVWATSGRMPTSTTSAPSRLVAWAA